MNLKLINCFCFLFLATQIFNLITADPVNLTSYLPDDESNKDEFYVPCTGQKCLATYAQPQIILPENSQKLCFPLLPFLQNVLQPPFCYTDSDCASNFVNASQTICKPRPGKAYFYFAIVNSTCA